MTITTAVLALALQQSSLVGVVRDSANSEPVAFARVTVAVQDAQVREATADRFGAFVVTGIASGEAAVEVRALGYELWQREYRELPAGEVRVLMRRSPVALDSIDVGAEARAGNPLAVSPGAFLIDSALVRMQPVILETDILRSTMISPSVSAASDWVSIPYVRGGGSYGTPVLLDGVRLFNPFHVGGFLSAFNAEAISRVTLFTRSAGDAQSIGSLSGAIDVVTRDGDRERRRIGGSLGIASTRLSVEGPIGESTSYLVDARRTYIDLVTGGLERVGAMEQAWPYWFGDVHAKITRDLGGVGRLSLTGYLNDEVLETEPGIKNGFITESTTLGWGNGAIALHYRGRIGAGTLVDMSVGHSRFSGDYVVHEPPDALGLPREDTAAAALARMSESQAEVRATHFAGSLTIDAGIQARRFLADHSGYGDGSDGGHSDGLFGPFDVSRAQTRLAAFGNARIDLSRGWFARAGARADHFPGLATTLAPFAELGHQGAWWDAWATVSRSHQALVSLRNDESLYSSLLAYDLLVPVAAGPVPRDSEMTVGWAGTWGALQVRMEAYARRLENLRVLPVGFNPAQEPILADDSLRVIGGGTARGLETSITWAGRGGVGVVATYRRAAASRTVAGRTFTPRVHRDHEGEVSASWTRGASTWSLRFSARSGQPSTPVLGMFPFVRYRSPDSDSRYISDDVTHLGGPYNSGRLPPHVRIDVGWRSSWSVRWFGGGTLRPFLSVANLFSLPNVVGALPERDPGATSELVYAPQLPMLPFLGLELRF